MFVFRTPFSLFLFFCLQKPLSKVPAILHNGIFNSSPVFINKAAAGRDLQRIIFMFISYYMQQNSTKHEKYYELKTFQTETFLFSKYLMHLNINSHIFNHSKLTPEITK